MVAPVAAKSGIPSFQFDKPWIYKLPIAFPDKPCKTGVAARNTLEYNAPCPKDITRFMPKSNQLIG